MVVGAAKEGRKEVVVKVAAELVHQNPYQVLVAWTKTELQEPPREVAESHQCLVLLGLK